MTFILWLFELGVRALLMAIGSVIVSFSWWIGGEGIVSRQQSWTAFGVSCAVFLCNVLGVFCICDTVLLTVTWFVLVFWYHSLIMTCCHQLWLPLAVWLAVESSSLFLRNLSICFINVIMNCWLLLDLLFVFVEPCFLIFFWFVCGSSVPFSNRVTFHASFR